MPKILGKDGKPLPRYLVEELRRETERLELVRSQIVRMEKERAACLDKCSGKSAKMAAQLMQLRGIGANAATVTSYEFFSWRAFKNGKQVGSCAGLTGTPYDSGGSSREQGISKAGNKHVRAMIIEIAWQWLRYQEQSREGLPRGEMLSGARAAGGPSPCPSPPGAAHRWSTVPPDSGSRGRPWASCASRLATPSRWRV